MFLLASLVYVFFKLSNFIHVWVACVCHLYNVYGCQKVLFPISCVSHSSSVVESLIGLWQCRYCGSETKVKNGSYVGCLKLLRCV